MNALSSNLTRTHLNHPCIPLPPPLPALDLKLLRSTASTGAGAGATGGGAGGVAVARHTLSAVEQALLWPVGSSAPPLNARFARCRPVRAAMEVGLLIPPNVWL